MKKYPLGIQTFEKIIKENLLYIDKTKEIYQLTQHGGYYFYARPRRFGKSLMLSTLKAIYEGRKDLFKGLWIEDKWDWNKKHPVIHIEFSSMGHREIGLKKALNKELESIGKKHNINFEETDRFPLFYLYKKSFVQ